MPEACRTGGCRAKGQPLAVALGHSALTGRNSDPEAPGVEAKQNSWVTATAPGLDSICQRMVAVRPETEGHVVNAASAGATADLLPGQAQNALGTLPKPELVIIQTIDGDIRCDGSDPQHVSEFGASIREALQVIADASPESKVLIITQPGRPATELKAMAKAILQQPKCEGGVHRSGAVWHVRRDDRKADAIPGEGAHQHHRRL